MSEIEKEKQEHEITGESKSVDVSSKLESLEKNLNKLLTEYEKFNVAKNNTKETHKEEFKKSSFVIDELQKENESKDRLKKAEEKAYTDAENFNKTVDLARDMGGIYYEVAKKYKETSGLGNADEKNRKLLAEIMTSYFGDEKNHKFIPQLDKNSVSEFMNLDQYDRVAKVLNYSSILPRALERQKDLNQQKNTGDSGIYQQDKHKYTNKFTRIRNRLPGNIRESLYTVFESDKK